MPLPPEVLRERLAQQRWTAHSIELAPDVNTIPGHLDFLKTNLHLLSILRFLALVFPEGLRGLRVADLGCLEGGFALAFAQRGAEVIGIEARPENVDKCRLLEEHFELANLRFVQADVKTFGRESSGSFDVVLALGIVYHLDDPVAWLRQVAEATTRVLFVDTHFAPVDDAALRALDPRLRAMGGLEGRLLDGWEYQGRWFHEYDTEAQRDGMLWASYSNPSSFWLTKQSLLASLARCGFDLVLEQHESWADRHEYFSTVYPRCLCMAIKTSGV